MTEAGEIGHAAVRGGIAAMAMTGMRAFTVDVGIVEETPPRAIVRQRARGLIRRVPRKRRRAVVELAHWSYGAAGGAVFGLLPREIRQRRRWTGPLCGLLGLKLRVAERAALAADHLLYGLVLSEIRARPRS